MSDAKQKELFDFLAKAVEEKLRFRFGDPKPEDNMPARIAVALLQLSALYFTRTGAPKEVISDFVKETFGLEEKKILTGADLLRPYS
jgi:hypothetical protein